MNSIVNQNPSRNRISLRHLLKALREVVSVVLLMGLAFIFLLAVSQVLEFVSVKRNSSDSLGGVPIEVEEREDVPSSWEHSGVAHFAEEGF